ncbi:MAG: histidine--tRNA ligase [Patescibacteria group bacterium]
MAAKEQKSGKKAEPGLRDSPKEEGLERGIEITRPRGTQDILPEEQKYWEYVIETSKTILKGWHFQPIETPMFEEEALFARAVGEGTDIVNKEMFVLKSRGRGSAYVLRPEPTAGIVRAYIENGMRAWPKPVKLFWSGSVFRYDRPQAGRWRQFHQVDAEVFGSSAPVTDAQVIYVAHLILQQLGLDQYTVQVNSLGLPTERRAYVKILKEHLRRNRTKLSRESKERIAVNPLRVLDSKDEKDQRVINTAPKLIDHLSEESKRFFNNVLEYLKALEVPYVVTDTLVRGLDYYAHTVFEIVPNVETESQQVTLIGGGRYDGLVKLLGGKDTPAIGWGMGVERVIDRLKSEGVELLPTDKPQVFVAQLGEDARVEALKLMRELREAEIPFAESIHRDGMQAQLKAADRLKVAWTLIVGHKEVLDKTVILRNMESGMQEVVPRERLASELTRRLSVVSEP